MATADTSTVAPKAPVAVKAPVKAPVKVAAKAAVAPAAKKTPAKAVKAAPKAVAKPAAKPVTKQAAKPASKPAVKVAAKPAAPKEPKEKKIKMVRDSFTMPKPEFAVLDVLKIRAAKMGSPVKKTELLRAGIKALAAMSDVAFLASVRAVPSLKTGRPSKAK
jgi:hypothetical protein